MRLRPRAVVTFFALVGTGFACGGGASMSTGDGGSPGSGASPSGGSSAGDSSPGGSMSGDDASFGDASTSDASSDASPGDSSSSDSADSADAQDCPRGRAYADGCSGAAPGSPVDPTLVNAYPVRPPWNVAGVDYAVGIPAGTVLVDAASAKLPSGCSYTGGAQPTVTCSTAGVTLDGIDFTMHGGVELDIDAAQVTVRDSKLATGASGNVPLRTLSGADGTVVEFCELTNNGVTDSRVSGGFGGLIYVTYASSTRDLTVQYSYLHDAGADFIDTGAGTTTLQYNLMANDGESSGSHPDFKQTNPESGKTTTIVSFNTLLNHWPTTMIGGQGISIGDNDGVYAVGANTVDHNVMIANGNCDAGDGKVSLSYWALVDESKLQDGGTAVVGSNYFDTTCAYGFSYYKQGIAGMGNTNLVTGDAL